MFGTHTHTHLLLLPHCAALHFVPIVPMHRGQRCLRLASRDRGARCLCISTKRNMSPASLFVADGPVGMHPQHRCEESFVAHVRRLHKHRFHARTQRSFRMPPAWLQGGWAKSEIRAQIRAVKTCNPKSGVAIRAVKTCNPKSHFTDSLNVEKLTNISNISHTGYSISVTVSRTAHSAPLAYQP